VSTNCARLCRSGYKLRAPNVSVSKLKTSMHHVSAPDLRVLEAVASDRDTRMTGLDVLSCTKWLATCSGITDLVMNGMKWEQLDPGGQNLANSLINKPLRVLELSNNYLMDDSLKCLADALVLRPASVRSLEVLNLDINCGTAVGLAALLPLGSQKGGVKNWAFRHNKLGDAGCEAIRGAMFTKHVGCHVSDTSWDLRTNRITSKGIESLVDVFPAMAVARLGCNPLGDDGAERLSHCIGQSLLLLDLGHAGIGDSGAASLGRKLVNATSLQDLLLAGNEIGAAGAGCLADGWGYVANLRFVDLAYNPLGADGVQCIAQELPYWCQSPFRLSLAGVDCGDEGAQYLVRALDANPRRDYKWSIELPSSKCNVAYSHIRQLLEEKAELVEGASPEEELLVGEAPIEDGPAGIAA